jgi:tRNA threonylcarbamoyladenosine biosynthesis protein TsaE
MVTINMIAANTLEMEKLGEQFGANLAIGNIVCIDGTLGAGKTVFCKGVLKSLGYDGEVSSPSYAIVHPYDPPMTRIPVLHADLYRLNFEGELEETGLLDNLDDCILLVEWAKRSQEIMDRASHCIEISVAENMNRIIEIKNNHG